MKTDFDDVIIIGGGAAGLSAALVLGRARRRVVVLDDGRLRNAPAAHMQGFLSRDGLPPTELLALGRTETARYGVSHVDGTVTRVEGDADGTFTVVLDDGSMRRARRVLVTTGLVDDVPDIPGVRERWGRDLLHCPYCHGWEVRDRPLGVLGTSDQSVLHAQLVRQWSDDVVYFSHTHPPSDAERAELAARGVAVVDGEVVRLVVDGDQLQGVELADGEVHPRAAVFVRPAMHPRVDSPLAHLGVDVDGSGFPVVDGTGQTSVAGVWVAGNAADPRAQVITAAGQGSAVAIAINNDLVLDDVRRAVGGPPRAD